MYHNPSCGKSRGALDILRERGVACDLVRKDKRFKELGLDANDYTTREQVVAILLQHPELMERPVVIRDSRAVIARPSERVLELFE